MNETQVWTWAKAELLDRLRRLTAAVEAQQAPGSGVGGQPGPAVLRVAELLTACSMLEDIRLCDTPF